MPTLPLSYATPEEYLKFDRSSEIRNEYIFGEIVPMVGGTYAHGRMQVNAAVALANHLPKGPCSVVVSSVRVLLYRDSLYVYPDATVVCGKPEFLDKESDTITNPKLVVEVLSPTTRNYDLGDKTRAYLHLPSLTGLLLVEQAKAWIEYWSREPGAKWDRDVLSNIEDSLKIDSLGCEIPLSEIYSGIELGQVTPAET